MASQPQQNMSANKSNDSYWQDKLQTYDMTGSDAYQGGLNTINQLAQGFAYDPSGEAALNQNAQRQAQQNVRSVGNMYGQYGVANSGAAAAAAAEGAANPYYQAQLAIAQQKQAARDKQAGFTGQATLALRDQYAGVQTGPSGAERDANRQKMGSQ